jgi:hypothetical protein
VKKDKVGKITQVQKIEIYIYFYDL